jgi:hypothetical protein
LLSQSPNSPGHGLAAFIVRHAHRDSMIPQAQIQLAVLKATGRPSGLDLNAAYPSYNGVFQAPFDYDPAGYGMYLSNRIDPGYYSGLEFVMTVDSVARKIDELKAHSDRDLLLPDRPDLRCASNPYGEYQTIQLLFTYPFRAKPKNLQNVMAPLCDYIAANYHLVQKPYPQSYGWAVWAPN